ncbi:MAG: hypothetical protein QF464_19355, partial [Myxococcota bacterium]|nr:hypothetical protein [Myxococcota bacterium]
MNLLRHTHPGAGFTTAVVLLCGIVSGAAMASGNRAGQQPSSTHAYGTVPAPTTPRIAGIPSIPSVPQPAARAPWMVTDVPAPKAVTVETPSSNAEASDDSTSLRDALVLRPETRYERPEVERAQQAPPIAPVEEQMLSPATAKPFGGLNVSGLALFMFALLAGAGLLAYRK